MKRSCTWSTQIALNIVIVRNPLMIVRLDPLYNFRCDVPGALRVASGRVVTNLMLPPREIGVIHLANWSAMRKDYLESESALSLWRLSLARRTGAYRELN